MVVGTINRNAVPMVVTFEDDYVEFICETLEETIMIQSQLISLFTDMSDDEDPWEIG